MNGPAFAWVGASVFALVLSALGPYLEQSSGTASQARAERAQRLAMCGTENAGIKPGPAGDVCTTTSGRVFK